MQNEKMLKVLLDENKKMQFDFSEAIDVFEPHELANMYSEYLSDVDFVVEDKEKLLCVEYKNANVEGTVNPQAFIEKINKDMFWNKVAKKFYGTMFLVWACEQNSKNKPVQYILLIETNPSIDSAIKKRFILKMKSRLPFKYMDKKEIKRHVIDDDFLILDINEWNRMFTNYPIKPVEKRRKEMVEND